MMLAREYRIKKKELIEKVKRRGTVLQSENFGISKLENEVNEKPRFAFIISTKISKLAVHRNRINRALHEGVRRALKSIPGKFDYVFLAKKSISKKTTEEIIKEVENFFRD
jgi:ribonuclease P protein component